MPTASYNKFQTAIEPLLENINVGSDSWVVKLASAVNAVAGTITELTTGNGYTAGGNACTVTSATQSGGVYTFVLSNPAVWTATGSLGPFQYAVLTDSTTGTNVAYWDYGAAITLLSGDTFTFTFSSNVFTAS